MLLIFVTKSTVTALYTLLLAKRLLNYVPITVGVITYLYVRIHVCITTMTRMRNITLFLARRRRDNLAIAMSCCIYAPLLVMIALLAITTLCTALGTSRCDYRRPTSPRMPHRITAQILGGLFLGCWLFGCWLFGRFFRRFNRWLFGRFFRRSNRRLFRRFFRRLFRRLFGRCIRLL